jgi:ABC-type uncharacterized transport system permease subunit
MNAIYSILAGSAPLLLASTGALISEHAGCMALFLDGIINLSAFLCFAFTIFTGSVVAGIPLALISCTFLIFLAGSIAERFHANTFLAALALNLLSTALASVLSASWFNTRGVLTAAVFSFSAGSTRVSTTLVAFILAATGFALLQWTKNGLYIRITGSNADVLKSKGINTAALRILAWSAAAFFGAAAGCILVLRLSSFVPNISSGTGWTALAAVFLGKKKTTGITIAVFIFAAAWFGASHLQNIPLFQAVPSSLLLALPYITALVLIFAVPQKH